MPQEGQKQEMKPEQESFGSAVFSEDALFKAWESYAAKKKAEGRDSEYHILQQKIKLIDNHTVQITLINKLQEDFINKMRTDLMYNIRKSLKNDNVKLEVIIEEQSEQRMLYTNREKLEFLQEKKPIIKLLRDKLGLDPDF